MHQGASYLGEIAAHEFARSMPLSAAIAALMATLAEANTGADADADAKHQSAVLVDLEALGQVRAEI